MYPSIPKKLQDYHKDGFKLVGTETLSLLLSTVLEKFHHVTGEVFLAALNATSFDLSLTDYKILDRLR